MARFAVGAPGLRIGAPFLRPPPSLSCGVATRHPPPALFWQVAEADGDVCGDIYERALISCLDTVGSESFWKCAVFRSNRGRMIKFHTTL